MATAGDGPSAANSAAYGNGGVGGKVNKPSLRRTRATPYDRPPTSFRNPSWISKIVVDPAKKLITSSASRVFSSVFRKPYISLSAPPESSPESSGRIQAPVIHDEAQETSNAVSQNPLSEDRCGMLELEQLLKQNNFTRSEIDRLTNLLRSKAGDIPINEEAEGLETGPLKPVTGFQKHQLKESLVSERRTEIGGSQGLISTPAATARVLDEDIASPAEIAKAYMDRLPSKVSPATLSLRSQAIGKNGTLASNVPFTPKFVGRSLTVKTGDHFELGENGFTTTTTTFQGRSAIHKMARTPYSRVYPTASAKAGGSSGYSLSSPTFLDRDGMHGSKRLAQKRRSPVLDDLGSVGPIRRFRQKHGLVSHKFASPSGLDASGNVQKPLSLPDKEPFINLWNGTSLKAIQEKEPNTPRTTYAHVPPKSSEMAARILRHLDKIAPKEKSPESNANASGDRSPSKLTTEMLSGRSSKNLEIAEQSKMLQSNQTHQKLEDSSRRHLSVLQENTSGKQIAEENSPAKWYSQPETTPLVNGEAVVLGKHILPGGESSESATISESEQSRKRAFTLGAHEGSLDLDDKTYCDGPALEGKGKLQAANHDLSFVSTSTQDGTHVSGEGKIPPEPVRGKTTEFSTHIEGTSSAFSAFPLSTATSETINHPPIVSALEKEKEVAVSPLASVAEASGAKSVFFLQPKPQSLFSSVGDNCLPQPAPVSGKDDDRSSQEASKVKEKPTALSSDTLSSSMSSSIPSFSPPDSSNLKNGLFNITSSTLPLSLGSAGFANQTLTNFSSSAASSANGVSSVNTSAGSSIPSRGTSFRSAATGSRISGLSSCNHSAAGNSQSSDSGNESGLGVMSSGVGTGSITAPKSVAFQFTSSASSPFYGISGVAPLTPSTAPFSSSSSFSNTFQSVPSFGLSSSSSLSELKSVASASSALAPSSGATSVSVPNVFSFAASSASPSVSSVVSSSSSGTPGTFVFGLSSSANSIASSNAGSTFGSSGAGASSSSAGISGSIAPSHAYGSTLNYSQSSNSASSSGFFFTSAPSFNATNLASTGFGSSTTASSGPVFSFAATSVATPSLPAPFATPSMFGYTTSTATPSTFGDAISTAASGNHDQMNTDDSMAEDTVQSSHNGFPTFGQQNVPSPSGFTFGPTVQQSSPFQFGGLPSQSALEHSPFQASGSLEFNTGGSFSIGRGEGAGGSFSLGSGGDKSARRTVRVNRNKHRKK